MTRLGARTRPNGGCGPRRARPESSGIGRAIGMLVIDESAGGRFDPQGAYFDGSLDLPRELAVTSNLDAALPRLSAIVRKMLPHDALRMACFDQGGGGGVN